jgi:hypothetical protein
MPAFANTFPLCAIMKVTLFIIIFFVSGCQTNPGSEVKGFQRYIPDTANSWAGRSTSDAFNLTKKLQIKFGLDSLVNGSEHAEFRLWKFSSMVDPQILLYLKDGSQGRPDITHQRTIALPTNLPKYCLKTSLIALEFWILGI